MQTTPNENTPVFNIPDQAIEKVWTGVIAPVIVSIAIKLITDLLNKKAQ